MHRERRNGYITERLKSEDPPHSLLHLVDRAPDSQDHVVPEVGPGHGADQPRELRVERETVGAELEVDQELRTLRPTYQDSLTERLVNSQREIHTSGLLAHLVRLSWPAVVRDIL